MRIASLILTSAGELCARVEWLPDALVSGACYFLCSTAGCDLCWLILEREGQIIQF